MPQTYDSFIADPPGSYCLTGPLGPSRLAGRQRDVPRMSSKAPRDNVVCQQVPPTPDFSSETLTMPMVAPLGRDNVIHLQHQTNDMSPMYVTLASSMRTVHHNHNGFRIPTGPPTPDPCHREQRDPLTTAQLETRATPRVPVNVGGVLESGNNLNAGDHRPSRGW